MLILPIKKKWYDMILSGEKKEEYREIKPYYDSRVINLLGLSSEKKESVLKFLRIYHVSFSIPISVIFRNGYSRQSPQISALCTLSIGKGREEWGAEYGKEYYIFHIEQIL